MSELHWGAPAKITDLNCSEIHGDDAPSYGVIQPSALYVRGGRDDGTHSNAFPWQNIVIQLGVGAQSTLGETGQINLNYGDPRLGIASRICGEIGFIADPTSLITAAVPAYLRIHSGAIRIHATGNDSLAATKGLNLQATGTGGAIQIEPSENCTVLAPWGLRLQELALATVLAHLPPAGQQTVFFDTSNTGKLTRVTSGGVITVIG